MNLSHFCIKRPALTIVISLLLTLMGALAYLNLPVRWIPNVTLPQVTIVTMYTGANGRVIEHDITTTIEEALGGIDGIDNIESVSRMGSSMITVTFKIGTNIDAGVEDIRTHMESIRADLPKDATPPTIYKMNTNSMPMLYLSVYDDKRSEGELSDYVDKIMRPVFETLDGVASVQMSGGRVSAMRVSLDPVKMAAARVTADDVINLLSSQNTSIASGQIRTPDRFYSVYTDTYLKNADQFNDLIIRDNQNQVIRLKDIGEAKFGAETTDTAFRVRGRSAIAIGIIPQTTANPLDVEQNVKRAYTELLRSMPAGMHAEILYNQADYIRASIHSVYESFLEAMLFVWLVIYLFLGRFKATLIPMVTIPVCVIATFIILGYFNFSINTITLMAFVLAIGLVVDDAIVMLENINRHRESGMSAFRAAVQGSREMVFPIIAMTLTLAAVYAPIAYTPGLLGTLFKEFTFTLAGAVIISGFIALTLTPMMCSRLLGGHQAASPYQQKFTDFFDRCQQRYLIILNKALAYRGRVIWLMLGVIAMGFLFAHLLPSELAPQEDMNELDVYMASPRSASFDYTNRFTKAAEAIYASNPDIKTYFSDVGNPAVSRAYQTLILQPASSRHLSTDALMASIASQLNNLEGVRVNVVAPMPPLAGLASGDDGSRLGLVLTTTADYLPLQRASQKIMEILKKNPGFIHVDNRLKWDSEQFQVNINRDKAADLKVSLPDLTNTLSVMLAGHTVGKIDVSNIIVQMNEASLANPNIFQELYVRNADNDIIPISQIASIVTASSPEVFIHEDRLRSDVIYVTPAPGFKLSDAIKAMESAAKASLPDDVKFNFVGEAKSYLASSGKTISTFALALLFIYLVLVAQFESFIDPFIILFTVPLAVVGALGVLWLFGGTLNIYSNIGLITLIGLIAKHGILITDFANAARLQGKSVQEAVIEASTLRLRPILMTTAAMVLGALPLAFAMGAGAETRQQVGLVIVGGMFFGTFFSLIVIPVVYTYLSPLKSTNDLSAELDDGISL